MVYLCYSFDSTILAGIADQDDTVILWDVIIGLVRHTINIFVTFMSCYKRTIHFTNNNRLIARSLDGRLRIRDITTGMRIKSLYHLSYDVIPSWVLSNRNQIISNDLGLIDLDTGSVIYVMKMMYKPVRSWLTPDEKLYVLSDDHYHLWNETTRTFSDVLLPPSVYKYCYLICYACRKIENDTV